VRAGILDSRAVNSLSEPAEILYRRLMSVVDDYGRYEADPELLQVKCFWRQLDRWPVTRIESALNEIGSVTTDDDVPLVRLYSHSGKRYLQVEKLGKPKAKRSKCPPPPECAGTPRNATEDADTRQHVPEHSGVRSAEPPSNTNTNTNIYVETTSSTENTWDRESAFNELWKSYPAKGRVKQVLSQQYFIEEIRTPEIFAALMDAVRGKWAASKLWAGGFVCALPAFLHERRWEEDPEPAEADSGPVYRRYTPPEPVNG
jgi:hypothetical protein